MGALFERTVVPVDGSKLAETAIGAIAPVVASQQGELVLVMVLDGHVDAALQEFATAEGIAVVEAAEAYLVGLVDDLVGQAIKARYRLIFDPVAAEGILDTATQEGASAIVIASHGRSGVGRWLLGSVAQKIVHAAQLPTLVIPVRSKHA